MGWGGKEGGRESGLSERGGEERRGDGRRWVEGRGMMKNSEHVERQLRWSGMGGDGAPSPGVAAAIGMPVKRRAGRGRQKTCAIPLPSLLAQWTGVSPLL